MHTARTRRRSIMQITRCISWLQIPWKCHSGAKTSSIWYYNDLCFIICTVLCCTALYCILLITFVSGHTEYLIPSRFRVSSINGRMNKTMKSVFLAPSFGFQRKDHCAVPACVCSTKFCSAWPIPTKRGISMRPLAHPKFSNNATADWDGSVNGCQ
jgi:hypothetical protein